MGLRAKNYKNIIFIYRRRKLDMKILVHSMVEMEWPPVFEKKNLYYFVEKI